MFLILILTSQIVSVKIIGDVLELGKCYQCGGETPDPASVSDNLDQAKSIKTIKTSRDLFHNPWFSRLMGLTLSFYQYKD